MTDARKALATAREALATIERASSEVSRLGAQTGPQWPKLTSALISSRAALAAIDAALASGEQGWRIPEGYALVPVKVTHAMKNAVRANGGNQAVAYALAAWPDLLAAAPPAPETRS